LLLFIASCAKEEGSTPKPSSPVSTGYAGEWTCDETNKKNDHYNYKVRLSKSASNNSEYYIRNFNLMGNKDSVKTIFSGTSVTIPSQEVAGIKYSGSGTIVNNSKINFSYTAYDGADTDTITAKYSK